MNGRFCLFVMSGMALVLLQCASSPVKSSQQAAGQVCEGARNEEEITKRRRELLDTGKRLLEVLAKPDQEGFLDLVMDGGYGHGGGDGEYSLTKEDLRKDFAAKGPEYCALFDISCYPYDVQDVSPWRAASYREVANIPSVHVWVSEVDTDIKDVACAGRIVFNWWADEKVHPPTWPSWTFVYHRGKWLTVGFSEPAFGRPRIARCL